MIQLTPCGNFVNTGPFQYKINYFVIVEIVLYTSNISTKYYCVLLKNEIFVIPYVLV